MKKKKGKAARLSPTDAVKLLRAVGKTDQAAAAALTAAIHDGSCKLWCDEVRIQSQIAITLAVEIDDRTGTIDIASLSSQMPTVKPSGDAYEWRFDAREVQALTASPPERSRQRTGPKPTGNWKFLIGAELIRLARHEPAALKHRARLADRLRTFLEDEIGWAPADSNKELETVIRDYLSRL